MALKDLQTKKHISEEALNFANERIKELTAEARKKVVVCISSSLTAEEWYYIQGVLNQTLIWFERVIEDA